MTPEQTERYVEITNPAFMKKAFAESFRTPPQTTIVNEVPSLIG
jgi:hypothetical protein